MKLNKKLFYQLVVGTSLLCIPIIGSAFVDDGESGGGSWFEEKHPKTILCGEIHWTRTLYYDANGNLLGTTYIEGGIVKMSFGGEYASKTVSDGVIPGHSATMMECYNLSLTSCTRITAVDACQ